MIGVDYELFWTLNPKSLSPFIKAFALKQKYEDMIAWQTGSYIRMAIASCLSKTVKYPKEPIMAGKIVSGKPKEMPMEEIKRRFLVHAREINSTFSRKEENSV